MVEVLDKETTVKNTDKEAQFVVEEKTTVKVEDDVELSEAAETVGEAVQARSPEKPQVVDAELVDTDPARLLSDGTSKPNPIEELLQNAPAPD